MIDLYSNQPVTVKADIWVRKFVNTMTTCTFSHWWITIGVLVQFRVFPVCNKITRFFQPREKSHSLRKKLKERLNFEKKIKKRKRKEAIKKKLAQWKTKLSFGIHCFSKQAFSARRGSQISLCTG